jgi:hypothetical protein
MPPPSAAAMMVLLALRLQIRTLVPDITQGDVYATLAFAMISLIILTGLLAMLQRPSA